MFPQNRLLRLFPFLLGLLSTLIIAACASNPSATLSSQINAKVPPGSADKLLVVDCLLPGQIRKLGQTVTYLTARRPIKTTASDCEIRGGEYVAYDRANYATALKVWLPPAQAGDPAAQTYVGEIYEKGLGLSPDFSLAAQWYRKAADQGYSRAQINLGFLYEQGLGVAQDKSKALNLYRQASGLTSDQLAFTSSIEAIQTERDELRQELALRDQEIKLLRAQLGQTQELLRTRRNNLDATQRELERTRQQLQQQRSSPSPGPTSDTSARQLEQQLAQQQTLLEQQRRELAYLQQEAEVQKAQLTAEVRAAEGRAEGLAQDVATQTQEKETLQRQVQFLEQQLAQYQQQLNNRKQELETQQKNLEQTQQALQQEQQQIVASTDNAELQRLQQQLESKNQQLARTRDQIATLETAVQQRETELQAAQDQANELQQDVAHEARERESLQQQVDYLQKELVEQRNELNARKQALEAQRQSLEQARQTLESQRQIASTKDNAQLERLKQQLGTNEAELTRTRAQVTLLESEVERRREELDKLKTLRAEQIAILRGSGTIPESEPSPTPSLPKIDFGRYYALIIGNNRYEQLSNLETAVNDAQTIASILKNRYGFETRVLTNATRYQILSALNEYREKLTEKDNFLLYYAGHGELDQDSGHWLPVDAEPNSTTNWISNIQVTEFLNTMNAKHVMVIADSCYSGTMARAVTTSIEGGRSDEKRRKWLELMTQTRSRTVLTSGGVKPVLDAGGGGHSIFARALINTLETNRAVLEGPILYSQVANRVRGIADRLNVDQDPRYAPLKFAGDLGAPFFFAAVN